MPMNISTKIPHTDTLPPQARETVEERLAPVGRMLGTDEHVALMELDLSSAPAEGRSATPVKLVANLSYGSTVLHAEAVKPTPEAAADRVRRSLEHEIRKVRGKEHNVWRRGAGRIKDMLRFGR